jgi:hypothetical protein
MSMKLCMIEREKFKRESNIILDIIINTTIRIKNINTNMGVIVDQF